MQRDRGQDRPWGQRPRQRTQSYHGDSFVSPDVANRQNSAAKQYKAALEALFEKKPDAVAEMEKLVPAVVNLPRVVEMENPEATALANKRQDMLRKLLAAQGSGPISHAIDVFLNAGHTFPEDQEVYLQMLEHRDEERVREAIAQLDRLLAGQLPKRKPVLVLRLKRLEENGEESATRAAASELRAKVG